MFVQSRVRLPHPHLSIHAFRNKDPLAYVSVVIRICCHWRASDMSSFIKCFYLCNITTSLEEDLGKGAPDAGIHVDITCHRGAIFHSSVQNNIVLNFGKETFCI